MSEKLSRIFVLACHVTNNGHNHTHQSGAGICTAPALCTMIPSMISCLCVLPHTLAPEHLWHVMLTHLW